MLFKGSGVNLAIPIDEDCHVDYKRLEKKLELQIYYDSNAIIVSSTTEGLFLLPNDAKKKVIEFVIKKVNQKVPVIVHTGSAIVKDAIEMLQFSESVGADGLMVARPYLPYDHTHMYLHYQKIADSVSLPIIIDNYTIPTLGSQCTNMSPKIVKELASIPNICGTKEDTPFISHIVSLAPIISKDFLLYAGDANFILPILSLGAIGAITTEANDFPSEVNNICNSYFNGDIKAARNQQFKLIGSLRRNTHD